MSALRVRIPLSRALDALPWCYGRVRNRATSENEALRLPFMLKLGDSNRWFVDRDEAVEWLLANGWPGCAQLMQKLVAFDNAEEGVASR